MKTVNVATLKQKLSRYLHMVEKGETVRVTSHRRQVARIVPEEGASGGLVRKGTVPARAISALKGVQPLKPFSVDTDLLADRARR